MLRIHIMNSVKGGSGKSTFSLYLANYLKTKGYNPVIIDLDVCGSTWFSNNESYIQNAKNCIFLNDLFYNYEQKSKKEHIFRLNISNNGNKDVLKVIMADPKKLSIMKDETLDLLENTVIQLVDELINPKYQTVHDNENTTDIIFDMPPGYEKHSERIIMHLIMDMISKIHSKIEPKPGYLKIKGMQVYKRVNALYHVYLYMISNLNEAAYISNLQYVNNLYTNFSYSMDTRIIPKENIMFVLNDINGITDEPARSSGITISDENLISSFEHVKNSKFIFLKKAKTTMLHRIIFEHEKTKIINMRTSKFEKELKFIDGIDQFESVFNCMY